MSRHDGAAVDPLTEADAGTLLSFEPARGVWTRADAEVLPSGCELWRDGRLFRKAGQLLVPVDDASAEELHRADRRYYDGPPLGLPAPDDLVRVLGTSRRAGHARLRDVPEGAPVAYGGRIFTVEHGAGGVVARWHGDVR